MNEAFLPGDWEPACDPLHRYIGSSIDLALDPQVLVLNHFCGPIKLGDEGQGDLFCMQPCLAQLVGVGEIKHTG